MAVHQLIPTFVSGDATGHAAVHLQGLLRRLGRYSEMYAEEAEPVLRPLARPPANLRPDPGDLVLYHHGIASPLAGRLLHLPCKRGVVYHNITPARFYAGTNLEEPLTSGRAQLAAMAAHVDLAIGSSKFNCLELKAAGYSNVHVVSLFVEPHRFRSAAADPRLLARLKSSAPTVISVSRVMPHKRMEDLLALHQELLRLRPQARLLIVGGFDGGSRYFRMLSQTACSLPNVMFLGRLSHSQLVAAYRSAGVFVSMSEHEGFGVPLLEAMACDLPVLAFAAGAVPETLGGSGIAFDEKRFAFLAELVREVCDNQELRNRLLKGQWRRLKELSAEKAGESLERALTTVQIERKLPRLARARPHVAFVVQRYGEVIGGAESSARQLAHQLAPHWRVTVLTSCARDHLTWSNEFAEGRSRDGPVEVIRFATTRSRSTFRLNALSRRLFRQSNERALEELWLAEQGPVCPGLLEHLDRAAQRYQGFVLFTYLYASTVWALPMVADRAMVIPTTHDEPPLNFEVFAEVFERPRVLVCLTPEERELIEHRFPGHSRIVTVDTGVDFPLSQPLRFRKKYAVSSSYLLYVGRLETEKGIAELLSNYAALRRSSSAPPELVLAGPSRIRWRGKGVRYLGTISEQDKFDAIAGAEAVVVPSRYESLSLLVLEAFAQKTPVLVNGHSPVLSGQVRRSGGGLTYLDQGSFIEAFNRLSTARAEMGRKGFNFVRRQKWPNVVRAYRREMERIVKETLETNGHKARKGGT